MKLPRREFLHLGAGAAGFPALPRFALAQVYPARPVHIVVGFQGGTASDVIARDPKFKARLADLGGHAFASSPTEFGEFIAGEIEKFGKVIKFADIKPE